MALVLDVRRVFRHLCAGALAALALASQKTAAHTADAALSCAPRIFGIAHRAK